MTVPLSAAVPLIALAFWLVYTYTKPKHRYPPGPKGLPIVGSLLDINNERPWITYGQWTKQYGKSRLRVAPDATRVLTLSLVYRRHRHVLGHGQTHNSPWENGARRGTPTKANDELR